MTEIDMPPENQNEEIPAELDPAAGAATDAALASEPVPAPIRKRPKPGERRIQILHTLAEMLEQPGAERVTTAALAARLKVSEAALYRHFASKAQMFEGLIDFIEQSVFTLINQITAQASETPASASATAARIVVMLLQFAEKNPGMTRVMVGDALVFENMRLQQRMNQFFDKIEATLRQVLRGAVAGSTTPTVEMQARALALTAFTAGQLQRYARSGFRRTPTEHLQVIMALLA
ncbi:MAG: nucleoid occlusion factor SlmA [Burkholderiaceae bacterium]|jgi:TetR/AcrR family transcriptional regulator|nr:nucleoid occlusion factor SlmA [Burkholderiaceae bacterium]